MLEVTDEMRRAITADAETAVIREIHHRCGSKSLRDEGVMVALDGKTSLEEVLRVTRGEDDDAMQTKTVPVGAGSDGRAAA